VMRGCGWGGEAGDEGAKGLLRHALAGAGFALEERHEALWEDNREKAAGYFGARSLSRLAVRWARAARRLVRGWHPHGPPPLVVVGFGGQLDVLLAARFCRPRAGLVFAPLVTLSETLGEDRQGVPPRGRPRAPARPRCP